MISANMQQKVGISVILANMQPKVGINVILANMQQINGTRLFVYATKRQRKGWQLARAALTGNATLMEHSLGDQTALTNGLDQRP